MAEYESRKKRWMPEPKMLVIALCVLISIPSTKGISIEFDDRSVDHWEFLFGANSKQITYDFCKYNGTTTGEQCKSYPNPVFVDFQKMCGCIIQYNETNDGSFSFNVNCKSNLSYCPEDLTLTYRQGSFARAPPQVPDPDVATSGIIGWLLAAFIISTVLNVLFFITIRECLINENVFPSLKAKWNKLPSKLLH